MSGDSNIVKKIKISCAAIVYCYFAKHLPASYSFFGNQAKALRGLLGRCLLVRCGKDINIERGATFGYNIEIGNNSGIGINAQLDSVEKITIGDNVMMGPEVMILTQNHRHSDISLPMAEQGAESAPVQIEDDVWIGARVIILPGVRIGKSSIIGAGAVVTKDIPQFSIAGGNPATIIRKRT